MQRRAGRRDRGPLAEHEAQALGWFQPFLDLVVAPSAVLVSVIVAVAQVGVGVSFVRDRFVGPALMVGGPTNLSTRRALVATAVAGAAVAVLSLPYISTLNPHRVIEDAAAMMVMGGALTVVGCGLACLRVAGSDGLPVAAVALDPRRSGLDGGESEPNLGPDSYGFGDL